MLHFGLFDIRTDIFILMVSVILILLQVFLCFKVKTITIRLIPVCLTLVLTIAFAALSVIFDGWEGFGFFFLAICSAVLLAGSGIGWGVWAVVKKIKR